jgi:hypothetical protein
MSRFIFCLIVFSLFQLNAGINAAAQTATQNCPVITVDCADMLEPETDLTFKANVIGAGAGSKLSYKWTVSKWVKIVGGEETASLIVRVDGGLTYTVTVEVNGLPPGCPNKAACSFSVCDLRTARRVDTFANLSFNKEVERLKNFASELRKEPDAVVYLIAYAGRNDNAGAAESHAYRLKSRLVKDYGLDDARIVTIDGGYRETRAVELFIVPAGSMPPTATPTINPDELDN